MRETPTWRIPVGKVFAGMIGRPRQWRGGHHQEAFGPGDLFVSGKLIWADIAVNCGVLPRRLQILPNSQEIDAGRTHVVHDLHDFFLGLTQANHQAGLGEL